MNKFNLTELSYKFFHNSWLLLLILSISVVYVLDSSYSVEPGVYNKNMLKTDRGAVASEKGRVYTWQDGDITRRVRVQPGLVVQKSSVNRPEDEVIAKSGQMSIVKRYVNDGEVKGEGGDTQPVFRGQSGQLMTLPGGVVLVFAPELNQEEMEVFFADNGISEDRVSKMDFTKNAFFVKTEAGFSSLHLANELSGKEGVMLSSPNWWREVVTK